MDLLNRAYAQLYDLYRSLTPGSRLAASLLAVLLCVSFGYLFLYQAAQPQVDLMHGAPIPATQLPAVEAALGKANLKNEVRGNSIFVPRGEEAACMAALNDAGVLPRDLGFAQRNVLKEGGFWDIDSQRDRNRQKIAVQDAVAAAIRLKPGIEDAAVIYDEEAKAPFGREKQMSALANVKPAGHLPLDETQVSDIRKIVVGGKVGLKEENVTVADLNGRTWRGIDDGRLAGDKSTKFQTHAAQLPPPVKGIANPKEPVTVTPFGDLPAKELSPSAWGEIVRAWVGQYGGMLALIGVALAGLFVLRSMGRAKAVGNRTESLTSDAASSTRIRSSVDEPRASLPPRRAKRAGTAAPTSRKELSDLVGQAPDTAAGILRTWVGNSG
jgi:flagellar biosynthesis/type III secretory pathway M-ring protein FliF/YscJ